MFKDWVSGDQDQILRFQTRKPFSAEFHCERENPRRIVFPPAHDSELFRPILKDEANKIVLRSADGKTCKQKPLEDDETSTVSFPGPSGENKFYRRTSSETQRMTLKTSYKCRQVPSHHPNRQYPPLAKFAARFGI